MDDRFEYPPGPERSRELFQELKELEEKYPAKEYPETYHPRRYEIIHDLAEARFYEAKDKESDVSPWFRTLQSQFRIQFVGRIES